MPARTATLVVVWLAGAVVATGTGVLAVRQVADEVGGTAPAPLSAAGVESALTEAATTAAPSAPTVSSATSPPAFGRESQIPQPPPAVPAPPAPAADPGVGRAPAPATVTRSFTGRGGSVGVACTAGGPPQLVYATPAQGWAVEERKQDADRVEVRFRSGEQEARIRVSCASDGPTATVEGAGTGSGRGADD